MVLATPWSEIDVSQWSPREVHQAVHQGGRVTRVRAAYLMPLPIREGLSWLDAFGLVDDDGMVEWDEVPQTLEVQPPGRISKWARDRDHRPCFLYLAAKTGMVKIGISANPECRARALSGGAGESIHMMRLIEFVSRHCARQAEGHAHHVHRHLRLHGEWFTDHPSIWSYFDALVACAAAAAGGGK